MQQSTEGRFIIGLFCLQILSRFLENWVITSSVRKSNDTADIVPRVFYFPIFYKTHSNIETDRIVRNCKLMQVKVASRLTKIWHVPDRNPT